MNILLWIIQILLALLFVFSGGMKLVIPADQLQAQAPPTMIHFSNLFMKFIGVCEVLGGLGLVLPSLFRIAKGLTVLAAVGLTIIMIGAVVISVMGMGISAGVLPLITGVLCAFVAYERGVKRV
jgi:uncharacterized membrane protein YphA (DoxX/SURF4 family)